MLQPDAQTSQCLRRTAREMAAKVWKLHGLKLINLFDQTGKHLNMESLPGSPLILNICFLSMGHEEEAWT